MSNFKKFSLPEFGYEVQIGKHARQAGGSVWFQKGGTVVLSAAVSGSPRDEFPGFFPLSVDYREMFSAAGRFPGGYFKREGKMSDKEVLTSRLVDRALRPLFPEKYFEQVQLLPTVYSVDKENMPNIMSLVSCSLALSLSDIPFLGPVGAIEVARVGGEWIYDPTHTQSRESDVRIVAAGTEEGICMLEASADNISEKEFLDVLEEAHKKIKVQIDWQKQIVSELGVKKSLEVVDEFDWQGWEDKADKFLSDAIIEPICTPLKQDRSAAMKKAQEEFIVLHKDAIGEVPVNEKKVKYALDGRLKAAVTEYVLKKGIRVDGRKFDEVRNIECETGILPFTHGSSLFTRGETQALVTTTLGTGQDVQRTEELMAGEVNKRFLLHYNFPPFSVGEVRPMRGPGRREVGHGELAASAIKYVLPENADFPYTIRIVSDILESNGSSSMATVCGSTLALLDAGVPLKKMVSGVAMGLLKGSDGKFQAITDLTGFEDAFGWMDFKVTGTEDGITAIQMDIKEKGGLSRDIFESALSQAKAGRAHILDKMKEAISSPKEISELVPRMVSFKIDTDRIGAVIGAGGKVIREIIDKKGVTIDIEDDGTVNVFGSAGEGLEDAISWIKVLAGELKAGDVFDGIVRRVAEFGLFVELVPGVDGLLHISAIPREEQQNMNNDYPVNSNLKVKVVNYDNATGRIKLSIVKD